ncbi:hypothetical protein PR048_014846 [Dryococelus australis]|uniref:Uncharacterized protein n=1 Tax=Dryococelus australis TaxID=614101 RepID=A0ABQ9HFB0_9NEOP|nr:hypothetical protein PR048_014846 [Dryococelus australis]
MNVLQPFLKSSAIVYIIPDPGANSLTFPCFLWVDTLSQLAQKERLDRTMVYKADSGATPHYGSVSMATRRSAHVPGRPTNPGSLTALSQCVERRVEGGIRSLGEFLPEPSFSAFSGLHEVSPLASTVVVLERDVFVRVIVVGAVLVIVAAVVINLFRIRHQALNEHTEGQYQQETKSEAGSLLRALLDFRFISYFVAWAELLKEIDRVNKEVQKGDVILSKSIEILKGLINTIETFRNTSERLKTAKVMAESIGIKLGTSLTERLQKSNALDLRNLTHRRDLAEAFPNDCVALRIYIPLPTTSVGCERRFAHKRILWYAEATVAERLAHSPPTKANRAHSPDGSLDFRKWESCRAMPLVGGFPRRAPAFPAPSFQRRSIFTSNTLIGSQDFAVKSRPNLFTYPLWHGDCVVLFLSTTLATDSITTIFTHFTTTEQKQRADLSHHAASACPMLIKWAPPEVECEPSPSRLTLLTNVKGFRVHGNKGSCVQKWLDTAYRHVDSEVNGDGESRSEKPRQGEEPAMAYSMGPFQSRIQTRASFLLPVGVRLEVLRRVNELVQLRLLLLQLPQHVLRQHKQALALLQSANHNFTFIYGYRMFTPIRVKRKEYETGPVMQGRGRGGGTGDPRENSPTTDIVCTIPKCENPGATKEHNLAIALLHALLTPSLCETEITTLSFLSDVKLTADVIKAPNNVELKSAGSYCVSGLTPFAYKKRKSCKDTCIAAKRDWAAMASNWGYGCLPEVY